jgi:hypothetical protein
VQNRVSPRQKIPRLLTGMLQPGRSSALKGALPTGFAIKSDQKMFCLTGGLRGLGCDHDSQNYPQRCTQKLLKTFSTRKNLWRRRHACTQQIFGIFRPDAAR